MTALQQHSNPNPLHLTRNAQWYISICERSYDRGPEYSPEWDSWNSLWVSMCWSSPLMDPAVWRKKILSSSLKSYWLLENAIEFADLRRFLLWLGTDNFRTFWPEIRGFCTRRLFKHRVRFDVLWTLLATPIFCVVPPLPTWNKLQPIEKRFVIHVCNSQGIYFNKIIEILNLPKNEANDIFSSLEQKRYIFMHKNRLWKSRHYMNFQYKKPVRKICYVREGVRHEIISGPSW